MGKQAEDTGGASLWGDDPPPAVAPAPKPKPEPRAKPKPKTRAKPKPRAETKPEPEPPREPVPLAADAGPFPVGWVTFKDYEQKVAGEVWDPRGGEKLTPDPDRADLPGAPYEEGSAAEIFWRDTSWLPLD